MNPLIIAAAALGLVTVPAALGYGVIILADKIKPRVKVRP
jgi:hypothetical protein